MAVQRVEWQCPGCQRKFAIPNQQPRPKLCPDCHRNAAAIQPRRQPATASLELDDDFAEAPSDPGPVLPSPTLPGPQPQSSRPVRRRRYEILRTISLWFKVLSGLMGCVVLVALAGIGKAALDAPPGIDRVLLVFSWFVTVVTGVTIVLAVYSFAVLLLVAMDIEHNTRQD